MSVALVTGSAGLIGSEAARHFAGARAWTSSASTTTCGSTSSARTAPPRWNLRAARPASWATRTRHHDVDIRDRDALAQIFKRYGTDIALVIHTRRPAAATTGRREEPFTDFDVNAGGTLNLLRERRGSTALEAPFIHCSTNKVYGDRPERAAAGRAGDPVRDRRRATRTRDGITEDMSIDACLHSLFGASRSPPT